MFFTEIINLADFDWIHLERQNEVLDAVVDFDIPWDNLFNALKKREIDWRGKLPPHLEWVDEDELRRKELEWML